VFDSCDFVDHSRFSSQQVRSTNPHEKTRNALRPLSPLEAKPLRRTLYRCIRTVILLFLCLQPVAAQKVVDKMVATVSAGVQTDLITYSDLMWQLALQPDAQVDNPTSIALNSALRLLIDQRLILQEAEKLPTIAPSQKEINDAREELARLFPSGELQRRMLKVGLTAEKLNEIIEQRLKMEKYLDFRFRNFVVVSQQEVADYYRDAFVQFFKRRNPGRIVPPLDEVKDRLERRLTEQKIESDTDQFLDAARERAEIVILNPV
jgi:hypothetical protein